MKQVLKIIIFFFIITSCSSDKLTIYVSNSDDMSMKDLNYEIALNKEVVIRDSILYIRSIPSIKKNSIMNKSMNNNITVIVEGKTIKEIDLKKNNRYLFISIFKNKQEEIDVYFLESNKKIEFH